MPDDIETPSQEWEVHCGDPGNSITNYCWSQADVLDLCGRLLYANTLIEVIFLSIREKSSGAPSGLGDTFPPDSTKKPEWILKSFGKDGKLTCRLLENKHELFGMLIAELRLGAGLIEVRDIRNTGSDEDA